MKHYTVTLIIILLSASFLVHGQDGTLSAAVSADLDPAGQETVSASTGEARDENGKAFFPVRNVDMDFQMRGSLRGDFPHGGKASAKFRMDDIRLNIEGRAGKKVYYRFRQSFTKDFKACPCARGARIRCRTCVCHPVQRLREQPLVLPDGRER